MKYASSINRGNRAKAIAEAAEKKYPKKKVCKERRETTIKSPLKRYAKNIKVFIFYSVFHFSSPVSGSFINCSAKILNNNVRVSYKNEYKRC